MGRDNPPGRLFRALPAPLLLVLGLAACQAGGVALAEDPAPAPDSEASREFNYDAAAFLNARQASIIGDIESAADSYTDALAADPGSSRLLEQSFRVLYLSGQIENADAVATTLDRMGVAINLGSEPAAAIAARNSDWAGLEVMSRHLAENADAYVLGRVLEAWSLVLQNRGDAGLSTLMKARKDDRPPAMLFSQLALMLEYLGRSGEAVDAAWVAVERNHPDPDTVIVMAGVLARQGAADSAVDLLLGQANGTYAWKRIAASFKDSTSPLTRTPGPESLVANAILDVGLIGGNSFVARVTRFRLAQYLDKGNDRIKYRLGRLLRQTNAFEEGRELHRSISKGSPWYQPSQMLTAMHRSRDPDGMEKAARIYGALIKADPENPVLWRFSGDNARRHEAYETALDAYDRAIDLGGDPARLEYFRGIALDRLERDAEAEAAFRRSLEFDGSDAFVLNYLGYWLLEHQGDAQEALAMIRRAVEAQPRNGYFVDSLGWGYYRLGQYPQALVLLEHAATLEPTDPTILDHLGDAYEKNGRLREAVYEWRRALYYANEQVNAEEIKDKIDGVQSRIAQ